MRWMFALALIGCGGGADLQPPATTGTSGGGGGGDMASGGGGDISAAMQHNLDVLNLYRSQNGARPLVFSAALNQFASVGSQQLQASGMAHGHFMAAIADQSIWSSGFCSGAGSTTMSSKRQNRPR